MNVLAKKPVVSGEKHTFRMTTIYKCLPLAMVALLSNSTVYAQDYQYRFKLQGITNPADAKMITDVLRPVFNLPETPYAVFPQFYDISDTFVFRSSVEVSRDQLDAALTGSGTLTTEFSVANGSMPGTIKTESE